MYEICFNVITSLSLLPFRFQMIDLAYYLIIGLLLKLETGSAIIVNDSKFPKTITFRRFYNLKLGVIYCNYYIFISNNLRGEFMLNYP